MGEEEPVLTLVVVGVAGTGKSTVGRALATRLGADYVEGDDLHPAVNVAKMRSGRPLDDADRAPWLRELADRIAAREAVGRSSVVACSALKRAYRDVLRDGHPSVRFVELDVPRPVLADRLARRRGHFMPAALLDSQLAVFEPLGRDEPGFAVPGNGPVDEIVDAVVRALAQPFL